MKRGDVMALDLKELFATAFMNLCEKKAVGKITVNDIIDESNLSRKSFYNYFRDKHDLIQYCYRTRVEPQWYTEANDAENLKKWNLEWLENIKKHSKFMKGALTSDETNSLRQYILTHDRNADLEWFKKTAECEVSEETLLCIDYHAGACRYMVIEWVLSETPISPEKMEELISFSRHSILKLLKHD
ncbi:MAG: TetR/AcrR family transcriptional regulator C-terminal domain-containing protein [Firmicutes bacterium]|nr:TetR/AcrR family transcriptional regulator C-terminal domain-containing protein [Bacillota bacterium]